MPAVLFSLHHCKHMQVSWRLLIFTLELALSLKSLASSFSSLLAQCMGSNFTTMTPMIMWWVAYLVGVCLQAQRSLEASSQVHRRLMQRSSVAPHGGWGGRRQDRRFVYSRYRYKLCLAAGLLTHHCQCHGHQLAQERPQSLWLSHRLLLLSYDLVACTRAGELISLSAKREAVSKRQRLGMLAFATPLRPK